MDDKLIGINGSHDYTLQEANRSREALGLTLTAFHETANDDELQPWDDIDTHGRQTC